MLRNGTPHLLVPVRESADRVTLDQSGNVAACRAESKRGKDRGLCLLEPGDNWGRKRRLPEGGPYLSPRSQTAVRNNVLGNWRQRVVPPLDGDLNLSSCEMARISQDERRVGMDPAVPFPPCLTDREE